MYRVAIVVKVMFGVLLNVGSNGSCANGRGRIFTDGTFEYLPIPEEQKTIEKVPTYKDLGFRNVMLPDLPVHLDPEFDTYTYGHVKRGFGDIQSILKLKKGDALFFYITLRDEVSWAPYVIGYFRDLEVHDCRNLSIEEILTFKSKGFSNNAHLKRANPRVDFLVKGGLGSKLLKRAFPMSTKGKPLEVLSCLCDAFLTSTGKKIRPSAPWFRWTLVCNNADSLLSKISNAADPVFHY